jgi:hypothetical protein
MTLSDADAYLDAASLNATILLKWDSSLTNKTLGCNFEYYSAFYDATWVGDSFDVKINDPCLKPITFTVKTSKENNCSTFKYGTG